MTPNGLSPLEQALREQALRGIEIDSPPPELEPRAAAAGLLDVAYVTFDSPAGKLLLAATPRGLVRLAYVDDPADHDRILERLAFTISPRVLASGRRLDEPRRELEQYFAGARSEFELQLDWQLTRGFGRRVLEATARIPFGSVATYKQVASEAGSPRASRAAGNALGSNPIPIIVPCHRVLHSTGGLGGYTGGLERKRLLLSIEQGQQTL
jgi:methylated-DNA-[protein]-cysteine S-methyltransferase